MTILCYGDSNTYGTPPMHFETDHGRFDEEARWPNVVGQRLRRKVIAEGLPGRTIASDDGIEGAILNGLTILPAVVLSHMPLDLVIFKLGTNDTQAQYALSAADIARRMRKMVRHLRMYAPDVNIMVVVPAKVKERGCLKEMFKGAEKSSALLPEKFEVYLRGENVHIFDANQAIETDPIDGVHYSAEHQKVLGEAVAAYIRENGL